MNEIFMRKIKILMWNTSTILNRALNKISIIEYRRTLRRRKQLKTVVIP